MSEPAYLSVRKIGRIERPQVKAILDLVVTRLDEPIPEFKGFGVVTVAGGKYLRWFWASLRKLRELTDAPVQCWHLGPRELNHPCVPLMREMGVEFVDAIPHMRAENYQSFGGWSAKSISIKHSPFRYALFLDADCFPLIEPESILRREDFSHGFLAFHDVNKCRRDDFLFHDFGIRFDPNFTEFEAGVQLWDKEANWRALQLFSWCNGRPAPFHRISMGDKDLAPLSFMRLKMPFNVGGKPRWLGDHSIIHSLSDGTPAFQHFLEEKRQGERFSAPEVAELLAEFDEMTLQTA